MPIDGILANNTAAILLVRMLTRDFKDFKAFDLGLIDKDGKLLKPVARMDRKERDAYTFMHRFIFNFKRLLARFGMSSRVANYAAAMYLLREEYEKDNDDPEVLESLIFNFLMDNGYIAEPTLKEQNQLNDVKYDLLPGKYKTAEGSIIEINDDPKYMGECFGMDIYRIHGTYFTLEGLEYVG